MRSSIFHKKTSFFPHPPRWKKRLLYLFAFFGVLALSGMTFIVYLTLQVPAEQLNGGIAYPKLASTAEKTQSIPDVKTSNSVKPPTVGEVPAYAQFYATKPGGEEPSKLGASSLRHRSKPVKRTPSAVKAKRSS
jgi:hypothetical protein